MGIERWLSPSQCCDHSSCRGDPPTIKSFHCSSLTVRSATVMNRNMFDTQGIGDVTSPKEVLTTGEGLKPLGSVISWQINAHLRALDSVHTAEQQTQSGILRVFLLRLFSATPDTLKPSHTHCHCKTPSNVRWHQSYDFPTP